MTVESEFFKVESVTNSGYGDVRYSVSWPHRGMVSKESSLMSLWRYAFDTGAFQIGFANEKDCMWVDAIVDLQDGGGNGSYHLFSRIGSIDRIVFPKESQAAEFVYALEKLITFKLLSRQYDENGDGGIS